MDAYRGVVSCMNGCAYLFCGRDGEATVMLLRKLMQMVVVISLLVMLLIRGLMQMLF